MSTQEPLSTSVENPKHKSALLDQYKEEKKQLSHYSTKILKNHNNLDVGKIEAYIDF